MEGNKKIAKDLVKSLGKKTGKIMFQFDTDEPTQIADIYNNGGFYLELKQPIKSKKKQVAPDQLSEIVFKSKEGKEFKLFIQSK